MTVDVDTSLEARYRGLVAAAAPMRVTANYFNELLGQYNVIVHADAAIFSGQARRLMRAGAGQTEPHTAFYVYLTYPEASGEMITSIFGEKLICRESAQEGTTQLVEERPENSTLQQEHWQEVVQRVEAVFSAAEEETFEDGMSSAFSKQIVSLVQKYSDAAIEAMTQIIMFGRTNSEVASEALRWLGRVNHRRTHNFRLWLLESSLENMSAQVRDGASLGLASMSDTSAIPYVGQAVEQEKNPELREDMKQVLEELEDIQRAAAIKKDKET